MPKVTALTSTPANPTLVLTPIFTQDEEGNIIMEDTPDWDNMSKDQIGPFLAEIYNLNKILV
jgi:hypothetical protein